MNLTDGSISGRPRGPNEEVAHHTELLELFPNLPGTHYILPISPPSSPQQEEDNDDEAILNLFVNPLDPLVNLQDISDILNDSMFDEEEWITCEEETISDVEEASIIIMENAEDEASVLIISYAEEAPDVIIIEASDVNESVSCLVGPYQPGDTTYLDIGLNEALLEVSADVFGANEDVEDTIIFVRPCVSLQLPADFDTIHFHPQAASTPVPMDL
ncbi:unnamed protein product [Rotaria magnacalcarata]|uniref:Uncharacterized protein n=1 Tax=Rotaria magnacalcarata TaxID=392030 RepID=A0A816YGU0_9BILA|nr:unnamed protein product [Rotaria magnacalcarata]CAF4204675.1 unnamed protein product [Rotaria magnacalcarata]